MTARTVILKSGLSRFLTIHVVLITALMLARQAALADIVLPVPDTHCNAITLPEPKELFDFKAFRNYVDFNRYTGTTVGKVHIITLPIFNELDDDENNPVYRFVNHIHIPTQQPVVKRQLLFAEGDTLDPRLIGESERILRENRYLSDAIVLPFQECAGVLDLLVVVRDLWTLMPKLFFSRKGGNNKYGLTIEDENILGLGDTLFVEFINDRERDTTAVGYRTRQLLGSHVALSATYSDTTDGVNKELEISRPFYSLNTNWSLGMKVSENAFKESLEAFNQDIGSYNHTENKYQLSTGYSLGIKEGYTHRYTFGFSRTEDLFEAITSGAVILPRDRVLAYPWFEYSLVEDNFVIYRNLNALYRTEDVPVGAKITTLLGYADDTFNSELSQWVFDLRYDETPFAWKRHLLKSTLEIVGFWDREIRDYVNTISSLELSYYWLMADKQRAYVSVAYDYGTNLSPDQLLPLGGDEGLRGYPTEYLLGDQRLLVNIEHRYFFDLHYLNLFRFAGVLFFDMGQTQNSNQAYGRDSGLLSSAGVGIRMNSSKTSITRIVHIDLAFPLNDKKELDDYLVRITSDSTF